MTEARTIARHAGTLLVGQLATMGFGVADTVVSGRHSEQALAAMSVGASVYASVFVGLMGTMQALLPTWAELHGAQRTHDVGRSVRQALYLVVVASLAGCIGLFFPDPLLAWTEVPAVLQADVRSYLAVLSLALPAALLFRMYSTLNQSLGHPRLITLLQMLALAAKVPLTVWFVGGGLGLPAMGAVGCAWATVAVYWVLVVISLLLLRTQVLYEPYAIWKALERPDWRILGGFARLGIPAGISMMVEVTSFTLMALFIARQGITAAAAHQITSNVAALLFMVPLSLGIATSARVSYWLGAGSPAHAHAVMRIGFGMGAVMALLSSALVLLAGRSIASLYSSQPEVVAMATGLLAWLAFFHIGDAAQGMAAFVLRCYRVVIAPLVANCVLLWGVGLGGGYLLAYVGIGPWAPTHSPAAFWIAAAASLAALGIILPLVLWRAVRAYRPA